MYRNHLWTQSNAASENCENCQIIKIKESWVSNDKVLLQVTVAVKAETCC